LDLKLLLPDVELGATVLDFLESAHFDLELFDHLILYLLDVQVLGIL